ncbi:DUF4271 domain-containing protein [Sinomicrobium soli]|uniref:DUF4271 domain-containing protein n=1 Tax=Sinomicrobium sp. N-1-3-6 TaxID=2219864 RepID=UPI0013750B8A|nr:DUF4271 domain-containing protein [Sinomicrobium sp. N-1-3-6]
MNAIYRNADYHTIETVLLVSCLALVAYAKISNEARFRRFLEAFVSDKYLKLYGKEQDPNLNRFNIPLFLVQIIIFGMLLWLAGAYLGLVSLHINLLLIIAALGLFIMFKFYLEKIIATIFDLNSFLEKYNFYKLTYRSLIAIILTPLIALLVYNPIHEKIVISATISLFLLLNIIAWGRILRKHQKFLTGKLFYFILYLCALEIAPYLIVVKMVF